MRSCSLIISAAFVSFVVGAVCLDAFWNTAAVAQTPGAAPVAALASPPSAPSMQSGVRQIVKMYQAGVNKEVILNYINSTMQPYHLDADGIIYMHSIGVPQDVVQALISRDGQMQQLTAQQYAQQQMAAANAAAMNEASQTGAQTPVVIPTTPPPDLSDYGYDYPYYDYGWPAYYGGYWGPAIGWGWGGWGWGNRWGYGRGFRGVGGGFHGGVRGFHGGIGGFHGGGGGFHGGFGGVHGGIGGFHGGFSGAHGFGGGGHGGGGGGHGGGGHR